MKFFGVIIGLMGFALSGTAEAQSRAFAVRNDGGSRIQFVSDAPLETITGVSSHVTGEVNFDPAHLDRSTGTVRVRVASIRTGVDLRDEHLRGSSWLDAGRFPNAVFELTAVEGATTLAPNVSTDVRLRGRFTIHGVTREVIANAQIRYVPATAETRAARVDGDIIRAHATFRIQLSDFSVSINPLVQLKVSNEIEVNVTIRGVAAPVAPPAAPPAS